jgi:hypothetical protein
LSKIGEMVECMENEAPICPKGEIERVITQKNQVGPNSGNKGFNKHKWGQGKHGPPSNKEKLMGKKPLIKKLKRDLSKVKCFSCDNNGHLGKEYPKPPWVNDCIAQRKLFLQGGFMAKIRAHQSEAFNLLKLNCKINNKIVGCLLNSITTKL